LSADTILSGFQFVYSAHALFLCKVAPLTSVNQLSLARGLD